MSRKLTLNNNSLSNDASGNDTEKSRNLQQAYFLRYDKLQKPTNCLTVLDHSVGLVLKRLRLHD